MVKNEKTISGEVLNTKYAPSVSGVYLIGKNMEQYIGKVVEVTGEITKCPGDKVFNEKTGEHSQGIASPYRTMNVKSIKVVKD